MHMFRTIKLTLIVAPLLFTASSVTAQKIYSSEERLHEEMRIKKEIEESLDWKNRTKETLDQYSDQERMLYGTLNESILLSKKSGERFGVFEAFRDNGRKAVEIRLHKKDKLSDRFLIYGDACEGASIAASKATNDFVVFEMGCHTIGKSNQIESRFDPYLFDRRSRNFYRLAVLDYDPNVNAAPSVLYENGIYKMHWKVWLRGMNKQTIVSRKFAIRNVNGTWSVKELPPIDQEAISIAPLQRLAVKSEFDLPAFVADR